ncbi:MAG: acetyl-CoA carboxylase biotin carboxylase subunit, partial [Planctomycetia bacterium]|nr:acetyl-CoA carboxylase biotin carboxylase subunit [Planctomycetia bacterium]
IQSQIRIAAGEKLPFTQADVPCHGCAIECRINAEDPEHGFRPSPGRIERIIVPGGFGVRWDSHVYSGYTVSPHYDSMIGKLIVHRATREEAIATMRRALWELRVEGVKTTAPRQLEILNHPDFAAGRVDTGFIERNWSR